MHAVAVINKSHVNPEITQVAKGAAKNSGQAASPRSEKCNAKHRTGKNNPQMDRHAYAIFILVSVIVRHRNLPARVPSDTDPVGDGTSLACKAV